MLALFWNIYCFVCLFLGFLLCLFVWFWVFVGFFLCFCLFFIRVFSPLFQLETLGFLKCSNLNMNAWFSSSSQLLQGLDPEQGARCALWRLVRIYSSPCWSKFFTILVIKPEHHFLTRHIQALCSMEGPLQFANDDHGSRGNTRSAGSFSPPVLPQGPSVLSFYKIFFHLVLFFYLFFFLKLFIV